MLISTVNDITLLASRVVTALCLPHYTPRTFGHPTLSSNHPTAVSSLSRTSNLLLLSFEEKALNLVSKFSDLAMLQYLVC